MKKAHLFLVFAAAAGIMEGCWYYPLLPERMAVHFDAAGIADGWGPKDGFFLAMGTTLIMLTVLFGALPLLLRLTPDSMINLPNKDYWFSPERREETLNRLANQMVFIGAMAILLLDGILYLALRANSSATPAIPPMLLWGMIGAFSGITIVWTVSLLRSYRRPLSNQ